MKLLYNFSYYRLEDNYIYNVHHLHTKYYTNNFIGFPSVFYNMQRD